MEERYKNFLGFFLRNKLRWLFFGVMVILCTLFWSYRKECQALRKQNRSYRRLVADKDLSAKSAKTMVSFSAAPALPTVLQNIPTAEHMGIVLGTKKVFIRDVPAPYNASLIRHENKNLLFFRYDTIIHDHSKTALGSVPCIAHIGCVELDSQFEQTGKEFTTIDTKSDHSEDPRAFKIGKDLYLAYNDLSIRDYYCRTMRIAKVDLKRSKAEFVTDLDLQFQSVEKNWVPFEFIGKNNKPEMYFEYYIEPHRLLKLSDPHTSSLQTLTFPNTPAFQKLYWPEMWGELRGGTPPQKIDEQRYLGFFHSAFKDVSGGVWYVMGAYTFEAKEPFRITGISHFPIVFEGMYNSPPMNTARSQVHVVFPSGFIVEKEDGKEVIRLSCGENDCATKIITLDKAVLLKSLKKL